MKKCLKIALFSVLIVSVVSICVVSIYIGNTLTNEKLELNISKLDNLTNHINLYDTNNKLISTNNYKGVPTISLSDIPKHTQNAFIAIEDKDFFNHHGLNYKRIIKAMINNMSNGYTKEGASTITQQLIKNTHLSNEKTFKRKIKEAILALNLEKKYTKNQILEAYLNVIYFGNNSYGLEQASQNYFGHEASSLSLSESALLAGVIKSPLIYSPTNNLSNAIKRRNVVLNQMYKQNMIDEIEYQKALKDDISINSTSDYNTLFNNLAVIEASKLLHVDEETMFKTHLNIYTTLNQNIQEDIQNSLINLKTKNQNASGIVLDATSGGVLGYCSTLPNKNEEIKRCPASLIKPILCYASAFEYEKLSPASPILDEEISFDNYSPHNINNSYVGWTDVRYSLAHSLNIPAIKTLEYVGINKAKNFATKFGLDFNKNDNHLAIALGSIQNGVSLSQITNAYNTFANMGKGTKLHFINKITTQDGQILYKFNNMQQPICKDSTAFMINDILADSVKTGTAKKLSCLNIPLSSKTGTNGVANGTNTDAWNISYNNKFCVGFWYGNISGDDKYNLKKDQNGGTLATQSALKLWSKLKDKYTFEKYKSPESVKQISINSQVLTTRHTIELANSKTPERYIKIDYYPTHIIKNLKTTPLLTNQSNNKTFDIQAEQTPNGYINVKFESTLNKEYLVFLSNNLLAKIKGNDQTISYIIMRPPANVPFEVFVIEKDGKKESKSNIIKFLIKKDEEKQKLSKQMSQIWLNKK